MSIAERRIGATTQAEGSLYVQKQALRTTSEVSLLSRPSVRFPFVLVAVAFAIALDVAAMSTVARADDSMGVARVRVLRGDVDLRRADSGDTVAAAINAPVTVGDYLTTRAGARAEIELDYGTVVRIAPMSQIRFAKLAANDHVVQLAQGTAELRVYRKNGAGARIESPLATLRPQGVGRFRATVLSDGSTEIDARSGNADVVTEVGTQTLTGGNALAISGTAADPDVTEIAALAPDDFDRWSDARDRNAMDARTAAYLEEDLVGASDLEYYGRWIGNGRYGRVWSPYEAAGWSPYHDGRFVWEPFYGWTWVGLEPWGWAPYHYGNWFYANGPGWCWYPGGATFGNPFVYRPAVVGFISFGGGFQVGFGDIGWVPLAPFEPYYPWYGGYQNTTVVNNITNVTNVTYVKQAPQPSGQTYTIYHNINAPGGVVALGRSNFANGRFGRVDTVKPTALQRGVVVRGVLPIVPTSKNLAPTDGVVRRSDAPSAFASLHFEAPLRTVPFAIERSRVRVAARESFPLTTSPGPATRSIAPLANTSVNRIEILRERPTIAAPLSTAPTLESPWDRFKSNPIVIIGNGSTRVRTPYSNAYAPVRSLITVPRAPSLSRAIETTIVSPHSRLPLPTSISPRNIVEPHATTVRERADTRVIHTTQSVHSRSQ